jgi:hypothetical protein
VKKRVSVRAREERDRERGERAKITEVRDTETRLKFLV